MNPDRKNVTVMLRQGGTLVYEMGEQIPLALFHNALSLSDIFI